MSVSFHDDVVHAASTDAMAARICLFYDRKIQFRVFHSSTNCTRKSPYRVDNIVDISHLSRILAIHESERIAFAEPNVPMDALVSQTLQHGLIPPVVMEFPGITVGGGFSGTSGESSSFRNGFFEDTVESVEIILGDGQIVQASRKVRPDLFRGAASAYGTLGVVTLLAIRLIPAKPYVRLTFQPMNSMRQAQDIIRDHTLDFMDGIFFSQDRGVMCLGTLVNTLPAGEVAQRFSGPRDDWFYIHAEDISKRHQTWTEFVPVEDYLFRYDRGAFWMGKYTFRYFCIPCTRFTRCC